MEPMSSLSEPQPATRAASGASDRTRLGATLSGDGADFAVVAPHATAVDLCLTDTDATGTAVSEQRIGLRGLKSMCRGL